MQKRLAIVTNPCLSFYHLAGRRGFEPRFTESESVVLPLNDLPVDVTPGLLLSFPSLLVSFPFSLFSLSFL